MIGEEGVSSNLDELLHSVPPTVWDYAIVEGGSDEPVSPADVSEDTELENDALASTQDADGQRSSLGRANKDK